MQQAHRPRVIVTGSNKGIGYGIVELALKHAANGTGPHYHIILTTRDLAAGEAAISQLRSQYKDADLELLQLDIADKASIQQAMEKLKQSGPIDILVNNAGMAHKGSNIDNDVVKTTLGTNYFGTRDFTEAIFDNGLLNKNGKIVMVSSIAGKFREFPQVNPEAYATLNRYKSDLTVGELDKVTDLYMSEMMHEDKRKNWLNNTYAASKLFLNIYTFLVAKSPKILEQNIQVYTCHPGWVQTDMTKGSAAPLTIDQGAETPYFLMTFRDSVDPSVQGEFFDNKKVAPLQ